MKIVRILSIAVFVTALAVFLIYEVYTRKTSDFKAPVISAESDSITASVNVSDGELLAGMTAQDNLDGDVTGTLVVASRSKFIRKGVRNVIYAAFDKNNNVGTYTRELTYTDYVSPRFVLSRPLCFLESDTDTAQLYRIIHAVDVLDGDISGQVTLSTGDRYIVNEETEGQLVSVQVSNRAGDTSTLELEARYLSYAAFNRQSPDLNSFIVYTKKGVTPPYSSYINGVRSGTSTISLAESGFDRTKDFRIDASAVNVQEPGVYKAVYSLSRETEDGGRQELGSTEMIVVVEEE